MRKSTLATACLISVLAISTTALFHALFQEERSVLTVSFLDVGQGDAIFVEAPSGRSMLIDAGKGRSVLRSLGEVLPWYDRSIDVVVATHPDADHIGGIPAIVERYRVKHLILSSVRDTEGSDMRALEQVAEKARLTPRIVERGDVIDLGGGTYAEILFPDRNIPGVETNTGAIVMRIVYGETAFLLSSDVPQNIETYLTLLDGKDLKADVLKVGHHGSRTSSAPMFVGYTQPRFAVLSRGCGNSYGHPHEEVTELFARFEIETLDTCKDGTISFVSDGRDVALMQ
jgi:competence protein ComEC